MYVPTEEKEVGCCAQYSHDAHHVLVDVGARRTSGYHEDEEDVGQLEERLGRAGNLSSKTSACRVCDWLSNGVCDINTGHVYSGTFSSHASCLRTL